MFVDIYNTNNKYDIIYADPAWCSKYHSGGLQKGRGLARQHYNVMTTQEIIDLPIKKIKTDKSILFLWATFPCLKEALKVMEEWGFTYITVAFTWIKENKKSNSLYWGMGNYTRANAEICLLGISKKFKAKQQIKSNSVHSVIISKIEEHSKKPNEARQRIVELCGDIPRIELFARQSVNGWDCWGNEIDKDARQIDLFEEKNYEHR